MDPVTVKTTISRPREEVFEYLADIANHAEFTDHFLVDWRLTREQSYGRGAGARYKAKMPFNRFPWGDVTFTELEAPYLLVEEGAGGKYNRIRTRGVWKLTPASGDGTRVEYSFETDPPLPTDRLLESLGARGWVKRKNGKALRRLRSILEEDHDRGKRITLAAG